MRTDIDAQRIAEAVLARSTADDVVVALSGGARSHLRWANNAVTTSGEDQDLRLAVTVSFGARSGTAEVNQLDDASLAAVVARAEALARVAPEDPEHQPSLGPQVFPSVETWHPSEDPDAVVRGVAHCVQEAHVRGLTAAGYVERHEGFACLATKNGLFGWNTATRASVSQTVRTPDGTGSGWAGRAAGRPEDLDFEGLAATSVEKAVASAEPRSIAPGRYVTILEPACVAELVQLLRSSLDARAADEGRSWLSEPGGGTKVGRPLFPAWLHAWSDPSHPEVGVGPWGADGVPRGRVDWIRDGAIQTLAWDRFWARKYGRDPVPAAGNLVLEGGEGTLDALIAGTERGLLVTTLWYIREVDPRSLLHTGLTRDGVFWIEDGQVAHPVRNLRWNESPVDVLRRAVAASAPTRVAGRNGADPRMRVPALKTADFHFTAVSEAI